LIEEEVAVAGAAVLFGPGQHGVVAGAAFFIRSARRVDEFVSSPLAAGN